MNLPPLFDFIHPYREYRLERLAEQATKALELPDAVARWNDYALNLHPEEQQQRPVCRRIRRDLAKRVKQNLESDAIFSEKVFRDYMALPLQEVLPLEDLLEEAVSPQIVTLKLHNSRVADYENWSVLGMKKQDEYLMKFISIAEKLKPLLEYTPKIDHLVTATAEKYFAFLMTGIGEMLAQEEQDQKELLPWQRGRANQTASFGMYYQQAFTRINDFYAKTSQVISFPTSLITKLQSRDEHVKQYLAKQKVTAPAAVLIMIDHVQQKLVPIRRKELENYCGRNNDCGEVIGRELARIREICTFYAVAEPAQLPELDRFAVKK